MGVTTTATDALCHPAEFDYDAVLEDEMLVFGGIEVCRQVRERGRWVPPC